ncbi:MAG: ParA family partition ATPase [Pseudomonadota bacterium]
MADVITITQLKGGAGKTTLAAHLAAEAARRGLAVGLVDADPQGSLTFWAEERRRRLDGELDISFRDGTGYRLAGEVRALRRETDLVLIDTPPHADSAVRAALRAADLALCPLMPSPLDLAATLPLAKLIGAAGTPSLFVFNRTPPRARIADLIQAEFKATGLPTARTRVGQRAVFSEALLTGRGASELAPRSPAAEEIRALFDEAVADALAAAA